MATALLTVTDFAERISVSRTTAYELVAEGAIRVVDLAKKGAQRARLRVPDTEVDRLIAQREIRR